MDILIVDDHPLVISGFRSMFASEPEMAIFSASDEKTGFDRYVEIEPEIVIVDLNLPGLSGFELLRKVKRHNPSAKTIVFSMNEDPSIVVRSIEMGVNGYLSKSDDPRLLVEAVEVVAAGGSFISPGLAKKVSFSNIALRANPLADLNPREIEILQLLAQGKNISEIATALDLAYKTIANCTTTLRRKLGARNHSDLIRRAVKVNLGS